MNKFFRCLICLLLICSLMVSISPIQAEALSPGLAFAAGSAVASALIGLGISMGSDALAHNEVVQNAVAYLEEVGGYITEGMTTIVNLGSGRYGLRSDMIADLLGFLYHSRTLNAPLNYGFDKSVTYDSGSWGIATFTYSFPVSFTTACYTWKTDEYTGYSLYIISSAVCEGTVTKTYTNAGGSSTSTVWCSEHANGNIGDRITSKYSSGTISLANVTADIFIDGGTFSSKDAAEASFWNLSFSDKATTDMDLTLNFVANPGLSLAEGYPSWHANSVVIDGEIYYPVALAPTYEGTQSMTQEDVWIGNGSYVDTGVVPDTGDGTITVPDNATLKDILTGVLTIPQAISIAASNVVAAVQAIPAAVQAIPAAIADFFSFKPPSDHNQFALVDLKVFFPFCIPFDLYAFFQLLDADPVAPVLSWEISDLSGQAYSLSIDLAEWDSVALLFRRLQLFLFITCLAAASRKFIKW